MKASIEWLKEYTDIDVTAKQLADILTMTGSKVETIEEQGNEIQNVVVGKILEIKPHQDSDHLVVTKVDVKDEVLQIVTGANNIHEGDIVPIAKNGSTLPGGVEIKTGKLRGIDSCGMMCSVGELGLDINNYPNQIENGIMILDPKMECEVGKDIKEVLKINQVILDFEITPNRPDCLSIEGLGREVSVSLNKPFKAPRKNIDKMNVENKENIDAELDFYQTNHEGEIVDKIQEANEIYDGIILNPAAYTHTSIAIADAIKAINIPVVEVHLSNIHSREDYRNISYSAKNTLAQIAGFSKNSYKLALLGLYEYLKNNE